MIWIRNTTTYSLAYNLFSVQRLIQKEKVDLAREKGAQISVVAKMIIKQGWSEIIIMKHKQAIHYTCFFIFSLLCLYNWSIYTLYLFFIFSLLCLYVTNLIKKLELSLLVTFIFNKD